ncbi:MAG: phosphotransferase [Mycetocola sp.]
MARSHFTLAALATTAVDGLQVVGSGPLSHGAVGNFDSALLRLADGDDATIRVPATDQAATEQAIEVIALGALTPGTRSLLPFRVPRVRGQAATRQGRAVVYDYLPGYSADAEQIPAGDGLASSIGSAIAAIHSLPGAFVGEAGLPVLSAIESRNEARNVIDRAISTRSVPTAVRERWREAVEDDDMWQFQPTVVNGSLSADSFILNDHEIGTVVGGVIGWGSLKVADPARDLSWLSGAGTAADSILAAYEQNCARHPDGALRRRALLHAELELARWLLHGKDIHNEDIVEDAITMLDGLVDTVLARRVKPLVEDESPALAVADVEALLTRTPHTPEPVDRSFDPSTFDTWDSNDADEHGVDVLTDSASSPEAPELSSRAGSDGEPSTDAEHVATEESDGHTAAASPQEQTSPSPDRD